MKFAAVVAFAAAAQAAPMVRRRLQATYKPGDFSAGTVVEGTIGQGDDAKATKLYLSNGLTGVVIAKSGEPILDRTGKELGTYHDAADGAAVIPKADGGYYYVSNSEQGKYPESFNITMDDADSKYREGFPANLTGGAYSLEFNADHELIGYQQVLANTAGNCAGGATPWGSFVSCEERHEFGRCWQTDPAGNIAARPTDATGPRGIPMYGYWEAIAWDSERNVAYITDDDWQKTDDTPAYRGAIIRYTPDKAARECLEATTDEGKWCALESGSHAYLKLDTCNPGKFEWVADKESANPELYAGSEGVHVAEDILTFVTIKDKKMYQLNLTDYTYTEQDVPFSQEPDNIRGFGGTMYICTDGDHEPDDGIWGVDANGSYQIFKEDGHNYPAGVDFSPDGKRMIFSMWGEATWMVWREDGLSFADENAGPLYTITTTVSISK